MRGKFALAGVVLSLLASGLAGPSSAAAKATLPPRSQPVAELELKGSGGYSLTFIGRGGSIGLLAFKGLGGIASYETRGRVTPRGIQARFGGLGRIAVEFRPSGRVKRKRPPRGCRGAVRKTFPGIFVGTIGFRGEQGYTRGNAQRAKGSMELRPAWRCKGPQGNEDEAAGALPDLGAGSATLQATSTRGRLAFVAVAVRPPEERGVTLFSASATERRGGMTIERAAASLGPERTFAFDAGLGTATVSPPRPFSGSATLAPGPGSALTWSGSLKVDLPGKKGVPLATPNFTASLTTPLRQ
jgi:hypothetical protein